MSSYAGGYQSAAVGNDFDRLSSSISSNIKNIAQKVNQCQRLVDRIGTPQDRSNLTDQIRQYQQDNNELTKTTNEQLKSLSECVKASPPGVKKQRELVKNRLTDEFTQILNKVQKVQREAADKEKESVRRARAHSATASSSNPFAEPDDYTSGGGGALVSYEDEDRKTSMQAVLDEEENLAAIQEREAAIKSLESDILDVNQIFKDLGQMVYEQGEMIDSIESNVETASGNVEQANVQLTIARDYQSSARRKKCICLVILVVGLIVVALCIAIPLVVKNQGSKNNR